MTKNERRGEARNPALHPELIRVAVRQISGQISEPLTAELCDISRGGAKLRLSTPLKLDDATSISLTSEALGLDLSLAARVCWVCEEGGKWALGLEFSPRMPNNILDKMVANGVVERRLYRRRGRRIPVTARWESDPVDHSALLWDISPGGFCLLSPTKPSRKVRITPDAQSEHSVCGMTQWEVLMAGGYVVGCKFIDERGFELLQSLDPPPSIAEVDTLDERRLPGRKMFSRLINFFKRSESPAEEFDNCEV